MALTQEQINYYISWKHEKRRALANGKNNYAANCDIELNRLENQDPDYLLHDCHCAEYCGGD